MSIEILKFSAKSVSNAFAYSFSSIVGKFPNNVFPFLFFSPEPDLTVPYRTGECYHCEHLLSSLMNQQRRRYSNRCYDNRACRQVLP